MSIWAPYEHDRDGGFTCDNFYCRRGFKYGYKNDEEWRFLCQDCYDIYLNKKEGHFEFMKHKQNEWLLRP